jgi:hypothetical protein
VSTPEPRLTEGGDRIHDLKTWPRWFSDVATRRKEFEVRRDDRDIQPGDWLLLHEWDPTDCGTPKVYEPVGYTGRKLIRRVTYVLRGRDAMDVGLHSGFCVLGLAHDESRA